MGRVKYRSRKPFIGGKKRAYRRKIIVNEEAIEDLVNQSTTSGHDNDVSTTGPTASLTPESSASAKKLDAFRLDSDLNQSYTAESEVGPGNCYFFAQATALISLISELLCPICKYPGVIFSINIDDKNGFAANAKLSCSNCKEFASEGYLCERLANSTSKNAPFDINIRSVLAFRGVGCGYSAMKEWGSIMDMPFVPSQDTYTKAHNKIEEASTKTFTTVKEHSRSVIRDAYSAVGVLEDENGILDIAVSYDGSWQKRGYTSHNCVASVIDLLTGLPIDYEVLSNYCSKCAILSNKPDNEDSVQKHALSCSKNFEGSSGAMEVEAALRMWKRSEKDHRLRYTAMLCDGDSKAFDAVRALEVYGKEKAVVKEDCINHVSKRMGTALMNIVASSKASKESISGKGKLTMVKIKKIQNYYGRAIKDHTGDDINLLKKRIMAILLHLSSTDKMPKHMHCPPGVHSWCFWQRALAKSESPPSHEDHETLPPQIGTKLVPIFQRLSDEKLLKRCSRKATQNPNESFHQLIWKICPKAIYVGRRTMRTAAMLALCQFSMGASFKILLCKLMSMEPGAVLRVTSKEKDIKRIKKAEKCSKISVKSRRKQLKYNKLKKDEKNKNGEGETYSSGAFNS